MGELNFMEEKSDGITRIPTVALRGMTVLPGLVIHFDLSREKSKKAVEQAMRNEQKIFLVPQIDVDVEDPDYDELYHTGCLAQIKQVTRMPENIVRVLVEGLGRGRLLGLAEESRFYLNGLVETVEHREHLRDTREDAENADVEEEAMVRNLRELF